MEEDSAGDVFCHGIKDLSLEEQSVMASQNRRLVSEHQAKMLEANAKKHWDLFYKRNETKFFRDRHWTTREFKELVPAEGDEKRVLLEMGCGVGNLIYPLIEEGMTSYIFYACDLSPRAIEFVKSNKLYDGSRVKAFQCDITTKEILSHIDGGIVDVVTMIFVLSAVHPEKFSACVENAFELLKPGGVVLFRDYGLYDMAQLRFKAGRKISDNFYMRQDGTRTYFFSVEELSELFASKGFEIVTNSYVQRRTINVKENIDVPRIFLQAKFRKP